MQIFNNKIMQTLFYVQKEMFYHIKYQQKVMAPMFSVSRIASTVLNSNFK